LPQLYAVIKYTVNIFMKEFIKQLIKKLPIAFTKNQRYDLQTRKVIKSVVKRNSVCIDVGCHKGEILDLFLKYSPNQMHYAFEPIPELYNKLEAKYDDTCVVYNVAVSNQIGTTTFNHVISNPAYSGLRKRDYSREEKIEQITVQTDTLDNIIPWQEKIDFIKIDVEGAEQWVLEGAVHTLKRNDVVVVFEHGLGASEHYNSNPQSVFKILQSCNLVVSTLERWLTDKPCLSLEEFVEQYEKRINYYFIAYQGKNLTK
jgi:FkbM family methyltransferase